MHLFQVLQLMKHFRKNFFSFLPPFRSKFDYNISFCCVYNNNRFGPHVVIYSERIYTIESTIGHILMKWIKIDVSVLLARKNPNGKLRFSQCEFVSLFLLLFRKFSCIFNNNKIIFKGIRVMYVWPNPTILEISFSHLFSLFFIFIQFFDYFTLHHSFDIRCGMSLSVC